MHFTPRILKSTYTFNEILQSAKDWFSFLDESKQASLKEALDHGTAHLTTSAEPKAYIAAYGKIHQAKLLQAFNKLPLNIWSESSLSVVDYGCGQGIAEMVLADFLASEWIDNDFIKDFILIEPSIKNLEQSDRYVEAFYPYAKRTVLCKSDNEITADDIEPRCETVIHLFSNVIDLEDFDGEGVAALLSKDKSHNNIVVCVSPYYQEASRGKRMATFGKMLQGYTRHYKFEKHTDEWDKPYSCQIHIYVSSYY